MSNVGSKVAIMVLVVFADVVSSVRVVDESGGSSIAVAIAKTSHSLTLTRSVNRSTRVFRKVDERARTHKNSPHAPKVSALISTDLGQRNHAH